MDSEIGNDLDMTSLPTKAIVGKKLLVGNSDPLPDVDGTITMTIKLVTQTGHLDVAHAAFMRALQSVA